MTEQTADKVTPDTVIEVSANLEAYVSERAGRMAEAALARAKRDAAEQLDAVWKASAAEQRRQEDLITELRRQLGACQNLIDRQSKWRAELAVALGAAQHTPWELLIGKVRKQATERNGVKQ